MGVFEMVVAIVLIASIASVLKSWGARVRVGRKAKRSEANDYQAWKEGQKVSERQTQKELELFKLKKAERDSARQTYERIALEKLEVMKTALSMGLDKDDLADLDARLEKLIGQGKLERLLDEEIVVPEVTADLLDDDLQAEITRLQQKSGR